MRMSPALPRVRFCSCVFGGRAILSLRWMPAPRERRDRSDRKSPRGAIQTLEMSVQFEKNRLGVIIHQEQAVDSHAFHVPLRCNYNSLGSQFLFNVFFVILKTQVRISRTSGAGYRFGDVVMRFLIDFLAGNFVKFRVNLV